MASQYAPSSHARRAAQALRAFGVIEIVFFSTGNASGSHCWLLPIWVNQTQVDERHSRNLELLFPLTWLIQEKGKFIFLLEQFCLQYKSFPEFPDMPRDLT